MPFVMAGHGRPKDGVLPLAYGPGHPRHRLSKRKTWMRTLNGAALRRNHQVDRFRALALLVRFDLECNALSFGQVLQSRPLHGGDVDEHIAAAVIGLDEAIATFSVEELDRTSHGHRETPPPYCFRRCASAHRPDRTCRCRKAWPPVRIRLAIADPSSKYFLRGLVSPP